MSRVLSQHGNVIAVDFRQRDTMQITLTFHTEWLFIDGQYGLLRVTTYYDGEPYGEPSHIWADRISGQVTTL